MRRYLLTAAALLLAGSGAFGQYRNVAPAGGYGPYSRPGLSPYLNLIRGGDPAANYYLGVIPERDRRALGAQLSGQLLDLEEREGSAFGGPRDTKMDPILPGTGHPTYFLNYSTYFNFTPARPSGQPQPALGGQRRTR